MYKKNIIYIGNFDLDRDNAALNRAKSNISLLDDNYCCQIYGFTNKTKIYYEDGILFKGVKKPETIIDWIKYSLNIDGVEDISKNTAIILYNLPSLKILNLVLRFKGKVYLIGDITEWYEVEGNNFFSRVIKYFDIKFRMKYLNYKMDGLILISSLLNDYYAVPKKIVVPPLVDLNFEMSNKNIGDSRIKFIYAGEPGISKDRLDIIVEAFNNLSKKHRNFYSEVQLDIYGVTKKQFFKIFPQIRYIDEDINFHGYIPNTDIKAEILKSNYTFLLRNPTLRNNAGFPTKFSEAKSLGLKVIYNDFSDVKEYSGKNDILIEQLTVDYLEKTVENILNNDTCSNVRDYDSKLSTSNKLYKKRIQSFFDDIFEI